MKDVVVLYYKINSLLGHGNLFQTQLRHTPQLSYESQACNSKL